MTDANTDSKSPTVDPAFEMRLNAEDKLFLFDDKALRRAFVRKVFLIVFSQLVLSCMIIAPLLLYEPLRKAVLQDKGIFLSAVVIFWALSTSIVCCVGISRPWPQNFIVLVFMTIAMSVAVGAICAMCNVKEVLIAIGGCAMICLFLALIASQTKFDLTMLSGSLSIFLIALIMLMFLYALVPSRALIWVVMVSGISLLSLYFMIDIQLIIKGKHRYLLSPDDYIVAASLLYIDMMYIFVFLLLIIGKK